MVAESALPTVGKYQDECYDVLYHHFTASMQRTIETNNAEIELLRQINSAISEEKEAKGRRAYCRIRETIWTWKMTVSIYIWVGYVGKPLTTITVNS